RCRVSTRSHCSRRARSVPWARRASHESTAAAPAQIAAAATIRHVLSLSRTSRTEAVPRRARLTAAANPVRDRKVSRENTVAAVSIQGSSDSAHSQHRPMVRRMVEISICAGEQDKQRSLDVYNAVWPHDAITMAEVRSFESGLLDHADFLAWIEGAAVGSGYGAIAPQRPD